MKKLKALLPVAAVLFLLASCASEEINNKENKNENGNNLTTFVSDDEPVSRTTMDHTIGGVGKFFWTVGDKIWVDNGATPIPSSTASTITGKTNYAKFQVPGTFTNSSYPVYYTGSNGTSGKEVTIAATQTQSAPNNTDHFSTSGDCGTATATGSGNQFAFKLKHQAAYLCILPRCENIPLGKNIYLTKIVITSDNDIAGTYTLSNSGLTLTSGGTKTITLTTQGAGTDPGFKMTNTTADIDRNGAYMVIAPGTHTLTIDCYIKDPVTNVEGPITQTVSTAFAANTITDITANLTPTIYSADSYYMWDAAVGQYYWYGHLDSDGLPDGNYPQTNTDPRWYKEDASISPASRSAKDCPNVNECIWYCTKGDPHWDDELWAVMGHLYAGGIWFLKKAHISGFTDSNYNGTDYRTTQLSFGNNSITQGKPSNLNDYFYLPALGVYVSGMLSTVGDCGQFWLSTRDSQIPNPAFCLYFDSDGVTVDRSSFNCGFPLWTAQ